MIGRPETDSPLSEQAGVVPALAYLERVARQGGRDNVADRLVDARVAMEAAVAPPRRRFLFGHLPALAHAPLEAMRRFADEDVAALDLGFGRHATLVNGPDALARIARSNAIGKSPVYDAFKPVLGRGVFVAPDKSAAAQRRPMIQSFRKDVEAMTPCVNAAVDAAVQRLRASDTVDLAAFAQDFALDVMHRALDGRGSSAEWRAAVRVDLIRVLDQVDREAWAIAPPLARVGRARCAAAARRLRAVGGAIARRGDGPAMASLRAACGADDALLADECCNLLLAGHETTGAVAAFALGFLGDHPYHQDALRAGRERTADVVWETMRLRPPLWTFSRVANAPVDLGEHTLPKGRLIMISAWAAHRRRCWTDPDDFAPSRWRSLTPREEMRGMRYFPFGVGPRACVGDRLAFREIEALLDAVVERCALGSAPVGIGPAIVLRPRTALRRVAART